MRDGMLKAYFLVGFVCGALWGALFVYALLEAPRGDGGQYVAVSSPETQNACGGRSSGRQNIVGETTPMKQEPGSDANRIGTGVTV